MNSRCRYPKTNNNTVASEVDLSDRVIDLPKFRTSRFFNGSRWLMAAMFDLYRFLEDRYLAMSSRPRNFRSRLGLVSPSLYIDETSYLSFYENFVWSRQINWMITTKSLQGSKILCVHFWSKIWDQSHYRYLFL